ncbi:hypothetical protein [Pseudactinotalea terrae]|uniref:hypothetical protein n=1 Tax=Pseudactinotalea terrae TaxID=1743262 RepID=UPI0012E3265E|nr:hypothetical protein [Pseudactinotalea terrae]
MTDICARNRQPAGITAGGQFATEPKTETTVTLGNAPRTVLSDAHVLDAITAQLGTAEEWHTGDDLSDIADLVARTGRPHPGDSGDGQDYAAQLDAWKNAHPSPEDVNGARDWVSVNAIAAELGWASEWYPEHTEYVADLIAGSDRPHPGTDRTLREFDQAMAASRRRRGLETDSPAGTRAVAEEAGLPVVHEVLSVVAAREGVERARFDTVTPEDVTRWYEQHLAPAADRMAEIVADVEPHEDHPWLCEEDDAWQHVRNCAREAGLPVVAEVIWLRYDSGDLDESDLAALTPDLVTDIYGGHAAPAVDAIEAELLSR